VQVGDDQERDHDGQDGREIRVERVRQRLFAEGTDTEACQGDAELHRGDEPRRVGDDLPHGAGPPAALIGQLLDLRPARGDERVLARDEERVQQDQRRYAEELEEEGSRSGRRRRGTKRVVVQRSRRSVAGPPADISEHAFV
jgi:hypothetical protein